jgi:uncharacterized membrane protein YkoI
MIRLRTASALAAGAVAALAIGGTALAAGGDPADPAVDMSSDGNVISAPAPSAATPDSAVPSSAPSSSASSAGTISLDAAKAIAVKAAGGGSVESAEQETEHGRAVWDVDVLVNGVEHDIDVDRATGEVLGHETDSDADDRGPDSDDDDSDDHGRPGSDDDDHGDDD